MHAPGVIDELRELNYVPGRNVVIGYSGAAARPERLPGLVAEMVRARVDVIVTTAVQETRAAKAATSSTPIVMTLVTDVSAQNAASTLRAVASLVERVHPAFAPTIGDGVKENLIEALQRVGAG